MKALFIILFFPLLSFAQITTPFFNCKKWQRTSDATYSCAYFEIQYIIGEDTQGLLNEIESRLTKLENPSVEPVYQSIGFKEIYNCRNWIMKNGFYKCGSAPSSELLADSENLTNILNLIDKRIQRLEGTSPGQLPSFRLELVSVCRAWVSKGGAFVCRTPAVETPLLNGQAATDALYDLKDRIAALEP